jgi:hypothetical protein
MDQFRKYPAFRDAQPLESPDRRDETQGQMEKYLQQHDDSLTRMRLKSLQKSRHGID